jgi:hypothetical protein
MADANHAAEKKAINADKKLIKTQVDAAADKAKASSKTAEVKAEATADVHKAAAKH